MNVTDKTLRKIDQKYWEQILSLKSDCSLYKEDETPRIKARNYVQALETAGILTYAEAIAIFLYIVC